MYTLSTIFGAVPHWVWRTLIAFTVLVVGWVVGMCTIMGWPTFKRELKSYLNCEEHQ